MGYNGYTEKRKEANKKYMSKLARISIWLTPEQKEQIQKAAAESGKSVNQFVIDRALKEE